MFSANYYCIREFFGSNGCIILNDCCHSEGGRLQNLGVLEAVANFLKRSDFRPIAITNTDWSDIIIAQKGFNIEMILDNLIAHSNMPWIDIPDPLLAAARIVVRHERVNAIFC